MEFIETHPTPAQYKRFLAARPPAERLPRAGSAATRLPADEAVTGMSVLFISHDFRVVASLCDRVTIMYAGSVVEEGSVLYCIVVDKLAKRPRRQLLPC